MNEDELTEVFIKAYAEEQERIYNIVPEPWKDIPDFERDGITAGIRAIVKTLKKEAA